MRKDISIVTKAKDIKIMEIDIRRSIYKNQRKCFKVGLTSKRGRKKDAN